MAETRRRKRLIKCFNPRSPRRERPGEPLLGNLPFRRHIKAQGKGVKPCARSKRKSKERRLTDCCPPAAERRTKLRANIKTAAKAAAFGHKKSALLLRKEPTSIIQEKSLTKSKCYVIIHSRGHSFAMMVGACPLLFVS